MAEGEPDLQELTERIRKLPGFEECPQRVVKLVLEKRKEQGDEIPKKRKLKGDEKAHILARNINSALESLLGMLHEVNQPGLKRELRLDESKDMLSIIMDRIERQDMEKYVKKMGPVTPLPTFEVVYVDDKAAVARMLQRIDDFRDNSNNNILTVYIDQEGWDLGKPDGKLQLIQIFLPEAGEVWLVHVAGMEAATFTTPSTKSSRTLKEMMESTDFVKVFWDCRGDSHALLSEYGVRLDPAAVVDLQLFELATTADEKKRKRVKGLSTAVHHRINLPRDQENAWMATKEAGYFTSVDGPDWQEKHAREAKWADILFATGWSTDPEVKERAMVAAREGGVLLEDGWSRMDAWARKPLPQVMEEHAVGDVTVLTLLHRYLSSHPRFSAERHGAVRVETATRVRNSHAGIWEETSSGAPDGWAEKGWCEST